MSTLVAVGAAWFAAMAVFLEECSDFASDLYTFLIFMVVLKAFSAFDTFIFI